MGSDDNFADFHVQIGRDGRLIPVGKSESVLDALHANGVSIPVSCSIGVCGTCVTRVIEGTPDHWDTFLTAEEQELNNQFCPCVSRSNSNVLVIDI